MGKVVAFDGCGFACFWEYNFVLVEFQNNCGDRGSFIGQVLL